MSASKHALDGGITTILPGIAIYKTHATPYYQARIRINGKYVVRSTKETTSIKARRAALELARELNDLTPKVPQEFSFKFYALRWIDQLRGQIERGERTPSAMRNARMSVENPQWGLLAHFRERDVRDLKTRDFLDYQAKLRKHQSHLSSSTLNSLQASFRNVMKVARNDGVIDFIPDTPKVKHQDNPRSFFRFHPLVSKEDDEYRRLRKEAIKMADEKLVIRGVPVTGELYDLILFMVHSFVRPVTTELYAIRHRHVTVADHPKRLIVTIRDGKTGHRVINTMPAAVSAYKRICERQFGWNPDDYLFLPTYQNRQTAARIMQRQFNKLLERTNLKIDPIHNVEHVMYSLRHTAICLRLIKSEGQVNLYNLAKTAGTSVEQIERFYAKHLPLSAEMAKNLHIMA